MDFSAVNKQSAKSFNEQKALIKKLSRGQSVLCKTCQSEIRVSLDHDNPNRAIARCVKGCTHIELDLA
ncbi:hypothetical protein ACSLBF_15870 [Pseudoalteromonas sp. T1lg65]|uniref:hypothetical protein n=1 Tax=Pseudoalteromonas sp. T1lg65 TaxID=2077101 RepID=UPI003F7AEDC5